MAYRRQMDDLRAELDLLERRYGRMDHRDDLNRIHMALPRHQLELDRINAELDRLMHRRRMILDSLDSLSRLEREVLRRAIEEIREQRREAWSPVPILGFRAWNVRAGRLHGAVESWSGLTMEATCLTVDEDDEVPHTDRRCGVPACGIYALKRASRIRDVTGWPTGRLVLGLVALSGKVVEHELGYRAQRAQIIALTVQHPDGVVFAPNPDDVWPILAEAGPAKDDLGIIDRYDDMCRWLEAQKEQHEAWTSASRTG